LGPEIARAKPGAEETSGDVSSTPAGAAPPPEPVADPALHALDPTADAEGSRLGSLRYWAAVAGAAGLIAAVTGLLALVPMSLR